MSLRPDLAKLHAQGKSDAQAKLGDVLCGYQQLQPYWVIHEKFKHYQTFQQINGNPVRARAAEAVATAFASGELPDENGHFPITLMTSSQSN